jgi:hypothetical protein
VRKVKIQKETKNKKFKVPPPLYGELQKLKDGSTEKILAKIIRPESAKSIQMGKNNGLFLFFRLSVKY